MYLKSTLYILAVIFLCSCGNNENTTTPSEQDTTTQLETDTGLAPVTILLPDTLKLKENNSISILGKHAFTLHWISWDQPGSVQITKGSGDGWDFIKGEQKGIDESFVRIDGKIKPVNEKELKFEGIIEYRHPTLNNNQVCMKNGQQTFLSTKDRKYWRLQNMLNCDKITTDYIDIYF